MAFTSASVLGASAATSSRDALLVDGISITGSPASTQPLHSQQDWLAAAPPRSVTPMVSLADSPSMTLPLRYGEDEQGNLFEDVHEQQQPRSKSLPNQASLQFDNTVSVKVIPSRFDYSQDIKQKLWSDRKECKANKLKNLKEFAKEGFDWRNVNDSDDDDADSVVISTNCPSICRPTPMHPHRDVATYFVHDIIIDDPVGPRPPCPCPILDEDNNEEDEDDEPVMRPPCPCPTTPTMYGNYSDGCAASNEHDFDYDNYLSIVLKHHFELPKPIPVRFNPIEDPLSMIDSATHLVDDSDFENKYNNHDYSINIDDVLELRTDHRHNFPPACIAIPTYHPHYQQAATMSIIDG